MDRSEVSQPLTEFLNWVKGLIPKDKFNIFLNLFSFPTPVIELTSSIYTELERVLDGKNPSLEYNFSDPVYKEDWREYRNAILKAPFVWRKKGWDAVKTAINSVLIVDLPTEQKGEYPEPYFYFLDIRNVIDYLCIENVMQYIIFRKSEKEIAVFDGKYYRIFAADGDKITSLILEKEHNLGFCPARFFWTTELTQQNPDVKKSPISLQLANLDWLLFFETSKKHLDLYAPYPIYSAYEADCDFANNETGDYCDGGFLRDRNQNYRLLSNGAVESCPVCASKRIVGVGSFIEVPVPTKDAPDMRDPISITSVDINSLKYNVEESDRLKNNIYYSCVGEGGEAQQKQSVNEMQVASNYESKMSTLNSIKWNLEAAIKFVDDTICILRYGDNFTGSSISLGTEFYLFTVQDLHDQYKTAKANGASSFILEEIEKQIAETGSRNNSEALKRIAILRQLEPYRHLSISELMQLSDKQLVNPELLKVKLNFSSLIDRFERENINVVEFGSLQSFENKINTIQQKLIEYVKS